MKLGTAEELLISSGIENARGEARMLFSHFGNFKSYELLSLDAELFSKELEDALKRRCKREPLQYILGEVEFYREIYTVTPDVLTPRQDTEILVDYAVNHIPQGASILDLCTGSGCIAISTLKNTKDTYAKAVDISEGALAVAEKNAERNGVAERIDFEKLDVLNDTPKGKFFAILSNPPYVTESAYKELEPEIYYEPSIAFLGGRSGTVFYERIIENCKDLLEDGGFFAFEIGFDQEYALSDIGRKNGFCVDIIRDYSNNPRVAVLK